MYYGLIPMHNYFILSQAWKAQKTILAYTANHTKKINNESPRVARLHSNNTRKI
jgi:hypothetical protein